MARRKRRSDRSTSSSTAATTPPACEAPGNPAPNPEAVQEFRVITNNFAAEYGRYPAGVIDVVTKSGTNVFHGAAVEFFRDEALNAKRWGARGSTAAKEPLEVR